MYILPQEKKNGLEEVRWDNVTISTLSFKVVLKQFSDGIRFGINPY